MVLAAAGSLLAVVSSQFSSAAAATQRTRAASSHYACSGPHSTVTACHFSTPSGNIRCVWTPTPNSVACELVASGRAYRLRPTGKAKAVKLQLKHRGETLPRNQQVVFPESLSCRDTRTTMTCNQDYGSGEFKLAPGHSHAA
jgi:hypothetical protein